jgi:PAS domain-containing protein
MQAQTSSQLYLSSPLLSTFEFTKKKRWADLLITELAEAIILILSTQCQILYCSAAVKELLGWRDEDLIDTKFLDLVNGAWMHSVQSLTRLSLTDGLSC